MAKISKKELILATAIEHFSRFGYELTTLDSIAKECSITKPAIYYHYKDKA
ncbi:MAG: TetR/AcrR family transcriptional regulator, partial [Thermoproteota archaeon]